MGDYACRLCEFAADNPHEVVDHVSDEHDFYDLAIETPKEGPA